MTQLNSHMFPELYKNLGIDLNKLGCVMIDVTDKLPMPVSYKYSPEIFYYAKNKAHFWIDGYCGDKEPHVTLLYGLMTPAYEQKENIATVLKGWELRSVKIQDIGYFESSLPDEDYYCIIGLVEVSDKLKEGMERLEFLPHVNTFSEYKPHMTLAYIKKDEELRDRVISDFRALLKEKELNVSLELNLGSNK